MQLQQPQGLAPAGACNNTGVARTAGTESASEGARPAFSRHTRAPLPQCSASDAVPSAEATDSSDPQVFTRSEHHRVRCVAEGSARVVWSQTQLAPAGGNTGGGRHGGPVRVAAQLVAMDSGRLHGKNAQPAWNSG